VDERNDQKEISAYYEIAEDPLYFLEQPARRRTFERYLTQLKLTFSKKGKLLDVGTNTGLFVKVAKDDGWDAHGVEPNRWAVEYARKNYGLKIINRPFEEKNFEKESFDVITMWDVIEHFTDPVAEMQKIFNLLKPGGVFAFSTVDPRSQMARFFGTKWSWYMEMHKVFFSRPAAKYYLEKTGFTKIIFKRHFRYLSLGYLATRAAAINPKLSSFLSLVIGNLSLAKLVVPYWANDLYDCYAFK
jgi:SAM-dependent methyltransferase